MQRVPTVFTQVAAEAASREAAAARKRADSEASTLAELKRKASALEKDAKAAGATIPDLDKPEPKKPAAKKGKKSSGGSKKRKSEAISEEEPAEAAGGDDAMDMTAVNKLTADKLKKELKKRKLDDKGKKAELKARLVEALGL
jgi:hypothetical protein